MNSFAAVGLLFIAAITPGPNNTFVMTAAMKGGWISAARTIGAIVAGSLILFFLTKLGLHSLSVRFPWLVSAIALAGTLFLAWLGLKLMHLKPNSSNIVGGAAPMSGLEVGAFQLLNPKGWVLMSVFVSGTEEANIASQMTVLVLVFGFCLSLWALAGVSLSSLYAKPAPRLWIDRAMGLLLLIFCVLFATQQISVLRAG